MMRVSLCLLLFFFLIAQPVAAQELNIGFPLQDKSGNIFSSDDPFALFLKQATTQTILKRNDGLKGNNGIKLQLADSMNFSADRGKAEIRLKQAVSFTDGKLAGVEDLQASFNFCRQQLHKLSVSFPFSVSTAIRKDRSYLQVSSPEANSSKVEDLLAYCPVISARSLAVFGKNLGDFNLVIGTGPYMLVSRSKNREARLEKTGSSLAWAKVINLRGLKDAEQGLTALRTGTLDLFYTQDNGVLERAAQDQTLLIGSCGVYKTVYRKGLLFDCPAGSGFSSQQIDPASIKYLND